MAHLAEVLTEAGQYDHAEHVARTATNPLTLARALSDLAAALADSAPGRAGSLADEADQLVGTIPGPGAQAGALGDLSTALAKSDPGRAQRLADKAEYLLGAIVDLQSREPVLQDLSRAVACSGNYDHAEELARAITNPRLVATALSFLAVMLSESDTKRACMLLDDAGQVAGAIADTDSQAIAMLDIAKALTARASSHLPEPIRIRACRLLGKAVTRQSPWHESLEVLAVLQPSALSSAGRVVLQRQIEAR